MKKIAVFLLLLGCCIQSSISLPWAQENARPKSQNVFRKYIPPNNDDRPIWGSGDAGNQSSERFQLLIATTTPRTMKPLVRNTLPPNLSLSRAKCQEYCQFSTLVPPTTKAPLRPDEFHVFVEGGEDSEINEFPHMVALGFGKPGGPMAWNSCGGTLISERYVLTAAHCTDSDLGTPSVVRLGAHDVRQTVSPMSTIEDIKVGDIIVHPSYQGTRGDRSLYNDIALIRMERAVEFRAEVQPACLHDERIIRQPYAVATGWGNLGFTDAPSDLLQKVSLDIIPHQKCRELLGSDNSIPQGILETQVCAGVLAGGRDTCSGDSGGPLQINNTIAYRPGFVCGMQVIGITSFGKFCAEKNSPGVYTKVAPYVPWIESIVWGAGETQSCRMKEDHEKEGVVWAS